MKLRRSSIGSHIPRPRKRNIRGIVAALALMVGIISNGLASDTESGSPSPDPIFDCSEVCSGELAAQWCGVSNTEECLEKCERTEGWCVFVPPLQSPFQSEMDTNEMQSTNCSWDGYRYSQFSTLRQDDGNLYRCLCRLTDPDACLWVRQTEVLPGYEFLKIQTPSHMDGCVVKVQSAINEGRLDHSLRNETHDNGVIVGACLILQTLPSGERDKHLRYIHDTYRNFYKYHNRNRESVN